MARRVTFAPEAKEDILNAYVWSVMRFGAPQAERYMDVIDQTIQEIAVNPDGPLARRHPRLRDEARTMRIERAGNAARHYVLYRIDALGDVEISRIFHDRMDFLKHLPKGLRR